MKCNDSAGQVWAAGHQSFSLQFLISSVTEYNPVLELYLFLQNRIVFVCGGGDDPPPFGYK